MKFSLRLAAVAALVTALSPAAALACACGCGVFDVGTGTMLPTNTGGTVWLEYNYMNQSQNWHGLSPSSSANNNDKQIRSDFFTLGGEYMFNRDWGAMLEVPYTDRNFKTADDDTGDLDHFNHAAFGDVKLQGIYSGFSDDMSTGVTFGLKLPSGDYMYPNFDRDTEIGTGSVNLLLGGYHMGALDDKGMFNWFANALWDHPVLTQDSYRPGTETDVAVGSYYNNLIFSDGSKLSPLLQLIGSYRLHDTGANADPVDTGYKRLLISPGIEYDVQSLKLYGDVEFPIMQEMNGNQLTAPVLFKFVVGYNF
jgi:hypothetical protein